MRVFMNFKILFNRALNYFSLKRFLIAAVFLFCAALFQALYIFFKIPLFFAVLFSIGCIFLSGLFLLQDLADPKQNLRELLLHLRVHILYFGLGFSAILLFFMLLRALAQFILALQLIPILGSVIYVFFSFLPFVVHFVDTLGLSFFAFLLFFFTPVFLMRSEYSFWIDLALKKLKADSYLNVRLFIFSAAPFALALFMLVKSFNEAFYAIDISFISYIVVALIAAAFLSPFLIFFYALAFLCHVHLLKMIEEK